jgi:hypothetical protein
MPDVQVPPIKYEQSYDQFGLSLFHISNSQPIELNNTEPIIMPCKINDKFIDFEIDSGASITLIGSDVYYQNWPQGLELFPVDHDLKSWSKELLLVKGCALVQVDFKGKIHKLPLLVMHKSGPCVIGRNWFKNLGISINYDHFPDLHKLQQAEKEKVTSPHNLPEEIQEYEEIFTPGLGRYTGPPVSIHLKEGAQPVFRPPRQVPYARVEQAEKTIDSHVSDGFMTQVKFSKYATPVHFVPCNDGSLRMVGDYSGTVNPICNNDVFPIPTIDSILDNLSEGVYFTKLDLKRAYNQITVCDKTAEILTLNTSKGLFKVNRLSPGLSATPAIFQRTMSSIFAGAPGVTTYFDDLLIQAKTKEELWRRTKEVLRRLKQFGLKLNLQKCVFCVSELDFVGYKISGGAIKPTTEKVEALVNMPPPSEVSELQSFLGYVNYYDKFLKDKATMFYPLYKLLHDESEWEWKQEHQQAMDYVKRVMTSNAVLMPYNNKLPVVLAVDASPKGLGYVLSHRLADGTERPIAHGSRTLKDCETRYSQFDKEALAVISGVKKFDKYLAGRQFVITTDHKPLLGIFKPDKPIIETLSPRMLRWCLFMSAYDYNLQFIPGKNNQNADCLSRLPLPHTEEDGFPDPVVLLLTRASEDSPLSADQIAKETARDEQLSRVLHILQHGGDYTLLPDEYQKRLNSLSISKNCILYGDRVIIPKKLRPIMLEILHKFHIGIVKCKALARSYVYWPKIDEQIETMIKQCETCAHYAKMPNKVPTIPWPSAQKPWSRIHIDFAGPFKGRTFLIVVDSYSKWIEVFDTKNDMTSEFTINCLRGLFSRYGIPDMLCSDNFSGFKSHQFETFMANNLISHQFIADDNAATNGQAERTVQTVKRMLGKMDVTEWNKELPAMLLTLRTIPSSTTGQTPAELMMGRKLRTMMDKLHPLYTHSHLKKREDAAADRVNSKVDRHFIVDSPVWFRIYNKSIKWLPGVIIEVEGPRNYKIITENNSIFRRHVNQMRSRSIVHEEDSIDDNKSMMSEPVVPDDSYLFPSVADVKSADNRHQRISQQGHPRTNNRGTWLQRKKEKTAELDPPIKAILDRMERVPNQTQLERIPSRIRLHARPARATKLPSRWHDFVSK